METANILAGTMGDYYIDDMDALPRLAMMLEDHHKFHSAGWVMNFYQRLITYRAGEHDLTENVHAKDAST